MAGLFVQRSDGIVLFVYDDASFVHETTLLGVVLGQVDGGEAGEC